MGLRSTAAEALVETGALASPRDSSQSKWCGPYQLRLFDCWGTGRDTMVCTDDIITAQVLHAEVSLLNLGGVCADFIALDIAHPRSAHVEGVFGVLVGSTWPRAHGNSLTGLVAWLPHCDHVA